MRVILFLLLILTSFIVEAADGQWRWIKATNNITKGWEVSSGIAEVIIKGDKFTAKLFWANSDNNVKILLDGIIKNEDITVAEKILGSDYTGSKYVGKLQKKKWNEFSGTVGAKSITLTDGWAMIGITKSIKN